MLRKHGGRFIWCVNYSYAAVCEERVKLDFYLTPFSLQRALQLRCPLNLLRELLDQRGEMKNAAALVIKNLHKLLLLFQLLVYSSIFFLFLTTLEH